MKIASRRKTKEQGFTLIELILIIVVFGIAVPALIQLAAMSLEKGHRSTRISHATLFAQEKMEQILADKRDPNKGYLWIVAPGQYLADTPLTGFTRNVSISTTGNIQNGIAYAVVEVSVSYDNESDVKLTTWLTDY